MFRRIILPALISTVLAARDYAGTWTPLARPAPGAIGLMLLLPDGTVMAADAGASNWYRLTPDGRGSYVNGTWTALASMNSARLYFASEVLTNGRVLVAGGEIGTGTSTSEIYDPVSDAWAVNPVAPGVLSNGGFQDAVSELLPNGNVLVAPDNPGTNGYTALFLAASNEWVVGPRLVRGNSQAECSWVKLPDDSLLTVDAVGLTNSERYIPSLNAWVDDAPLPVQIHALNDGEIGGALLLPNGKAIFLGGNGNTAIYTPTGTTAKGTWAAGPVIPGGYGIQDGPAAMMVNGKILCAAGNATNYSAPAYFFEYDPAGNSFAQVNGPTGVSDNVPPFEAAMLDLPDGTVLYSHWGADVYVYQPDGSPLAPGKPVISNITANPDGSFRITGTGFNGISEGATYGDDAQMNSNYPLVRLTDAAGDVYYERTHDWNSTSVMTGGRMISARFSNSAALAPGTYSLVVVANGISSDPWDFVLPPMLNVVSTGGKLVVTWPTNAVGFTLEWATNLGASAVWSTNAPSPAVVNGQNVVTNAMTDGQIYFRLSQ